MCFNQDGAISSLNTITFKVVELFIYLGKNILSTEGDISVHLD